jgi:quercetin dioxygenase-like cupin family protein
VSHPSWKVVPADPAAMRPGPPGTAERTLVGPETGSVHFDMAEVELAPGARIEGHVQPFEESFYVLAGTAVATIGAAAYEVTTDDFGMIPLGIPHAWANVSEEPTRLLRVRAPQPRLLRGADPRFPASTIEPRLEGVTPPREVAAPHRPVGRFDSAHLPAPGPLNMKGYRGPRISGVSIWMLIDELAGAMHHTMFVVEFQPITVRQTAGDHFHPFEEAYYFLTGSAVAHLEGEDVPVAAGDLVFSGVNALHGYTMTSDVPVRWIEIQAPVPPPNGATFFPDDWREDADGLSPG